jgi:hypothetical protein
MMMTAQPGVNPLQKEPIQKISGTEYTKTWTTSMGCMLEKACETGNNAAMTTISHTNR